MRRIRTIALAVAVMGTVALTACGGSSGEPSAAPSTTASATECKPPTLDTVKSGTLTIATSDPAYPPWMVDNDPTNAQGYEGAVAYAVANVLGFPHNQVKWVRVDFNAAIAPGPKTFDFDINQFSVTKKRAENVDFSSSYFDVTQAVVTRKSSPANGVTTLAGLKDLKLGAQVGTTSYEAIVKVIKPSKSPNVYDNNNLALAALRNGQVDAIVVDLPTAFYMTSAQLVDGVIVGQVPVEGAPEHLGLLLDKGSSLTDCVSQAVDRLRTTGTLETLQFKWLTQAASAPVLK